MLRPAGRVPAYPLYLAIRFGQALIFSLVFAVTGVFAVTEAGLSPLQLVMVGTALESACFLFEVPTGVVADVYSRRLSIIIGFAVIGAGFLLWGAAPLFATIVAAQVVWGLGYTFTSGATEAWVVDELGEDDTGPLFLRAAQAGQIGTLLGIPAGVLLGALSLSLPMLLGGVLCIGLAAVLLLVMPERGFRAVPRAERESWAGMGATLRAGLHEVRRRPVLGTIMAIAVIFGAASETFDRLRDAHFLRDTGLPAFGGWQPVVWLGLISVTGLLLSIAAMEVIRRRTDLRAHRTAARALLLTDTGIALAVVLFALSGSFVPAVIAVLAGGVLRRVNTPLSTSWINQGLEPRVRATVMSMRGQADALGQVAGGPLLGLLATAVSVPAALVCSGLVLTLALPLYLRTLRPAETPATAPAAETEQRAGAEP